MCFAREKPARVMKATKKRVTLSGVYYAVNKNQLNSMANMKESAREQQWQRQRENCNVNCDILYMPVGHLQAELSILLLMCI